MTNLEGNIIAIISLILSVLFYFGNNSKFNVTAFLLIYGICFLFVLLGYWAVKIYLLRTGQAIERRQQKVNRGQNTAFSNIRNLGLEHNKF